MNDRCGELRVCPNDGEPVIFTFEFSGHEYVCSACGWLGGIFDPPVAPVTADLTERYKRALDAYEEARATRTGRTPLRWISDGQRPKCAGCGMAASEPFDRSGKPPHWYSRTVNGAKGYACSQACIKDGAVLPW